jgi:hypothetical protein
MKKNKGIFWGLFLVALGLLWLGRSFGLFYFSWYNLFRLWPIVIIWVGVTLLPIEQLWKNVCNGVLFLLAIVLLFVLPVKSCHHHFWNDKYTIKKKIHDKECNIEVVEDDADDELNLDLNLNDENISVTVNDGVITINKESEEDGEKKVIVKKIKL